MRCFRRYGGTKLILDALGYYYKQLNECWKYPVADLLSYGAIFPTDKGFILIGGRNGKDFEFTGKVVEFIEE